MRRYLGLAFVTFAVAAAWIIVLPAAPVRQPSVFGHAKHRAVGCAVCHQGAATLTRAGIPEAPVCTKCHATAPRGSSPAWNAAVEGKSFGWVQVTHVPDHVMFSHRRHVTLARLDCVSCHGNVRDLGTPVVAVAVRLDMTTCLSCHIREGAAVDCAACHR